MREITDTFRDLVQFLKSPEQQQDIIQTPSRKVRRLLILLLAEIPVMFALSALINLFSNLGWVQIEKHQVQTLVELFPIPVVLMLTVLLIPFIEELIFRFPLKYKRNYLLRAVAMAVNGQESGTEGKVRRWWHRQYPVIFYLSAGIFAFIHFVNYDSETSLVYILPFLVLPQFILGLLMGYLRVRYNFLTGFLMHALHNALFMTIAILSFTSSEPVLSIENEQYRLHIEKVSHSRESMMYNGTDSIHIQGVSLMSTLGILTGQPEFRIIDETHTGNQKINLRYQSVKGSSLNSDSLITGHLLKEFSLRLEHTNKTTQVYILQVVDEKKLSAAYSNSTEDSSVTSSAEGITIKGMTLEDTVKYLSEEFKIPFETQSGGNQKLNISLPRDLESLKKKLLIEYGISMNEATKTVEYLIMKPAE